jgi:hypothetical protein
VAREKGQNSAGKVKFADRRLENRPTRGRDCPRYVAQAFQPAGSGDFPVPGRIRSRIFIQFTHFCF